MVDLRQVDTLVIDEADRMLDMGFIPDVRAIVNRLPDRDHRCTMLYSATLNDTVMNLAAMWMRDPVRVEIESDKPATDTVKQIVYIARSEEKFTLLYNHLARNPEARTPRPAPSSSATASSPPSAWPRTSAAAASTARSSPVT